MPVLFGMLLPPPPPPPHTHTHTLYCVLQKEALILPSTPRLANLSFNIPPGCFPWCLTPFCPSVLILVDRFGSVAPKITLLKGEIKRYNKSPVRIRISWWLKLDPLKTLRFLCLIVCVILKCKLCIYQEFLAFQLLPLLNCYTEISVAGGIDVELSPL